MFLGYFLEIYGISFAGGKHFIASVAKYFLSDSEYKLSEPLHTRIDILRFRVWERFLVEFLS